ncbi:MAG TPA: hypothetical protein VGG57_18505 [Stellaceae bacterium]|jgi:hypothetical protein
MDRDDDVERLFSWIKTPDLHYREFAAQREVADAVATWPALRDAVPEPNPSDRHLEPPGGSYDEELLPAERARHFDRPEAVFGHHDLHPHHVVEQPPREEAAREAPWAETAPAPIRHEPAPPPTYVERSAPPPAYVERPAPTVVRREPPPAAPQRVPQPPSAPPQAQPPAAQEYQGFEEAHETPPDEQQEHEGQTRSLDAIFSRVAHQPRAPRDGRSRQSSSGPGLGPVFRRPR